MSNQSNNFETEHQRPTRRWLRTVLAIFAGFVVVVVLSIGTDAILHALKIYPTLGQGMSDQLFLLATAYRTLYGIIGSYVTARLAPDRPMWHAMVGGVIGLILSIVGAVATWKHTEMGPHWYPLALVVTALPSAWLGGKIRETQILKKNS
jgi:hypothetical protein